MRAGSLDDRISILRAETAQSPSGAEIQTWVPIVVRRAASMRPVKGEERFSGAQITAREQVEFQIRWSKNVADLSPSDRIIEPALTSPDPDVSIEDRRQYDITAVYEIGWRDSLRIIASRRVGSNEFWDEPTPSFQPWSLDFSKPGNSGYIGQVI